MKTNKLSALLLIFLFVAGGLGSVRAQEEITTVGGLNAMTATGSYIIKADIDASTYSAAISDFSGTLEADAKDDGTFYTISGLSRPLFNSINGGTVHNVILSDVSISSGNSSGNAGAICYEATGAARIYNCGILSGSVGGSAKVGGLVGLLDGTARVINCFSYADITNGTDKGGIVGYNNVASSQSNVATMVMNCMFYGDIATGDNISPIYGGTEINNVHGGLPNYNYYRYDSPYSVNGKVNKYNRALPMQEKFINRFERYRLLLNSNRRQAAFYATGSVSNAESKMTKWVLETADRTIEHPMPYPILKVQGRYPSIINYDAQNAPDSATVGRCHGGKLGSKTLTVYIGRVGSNAPSGASIIRRGAITLPRTDKDFDRFNYNYDKVQLPYYNDVGTGNYTGNKVVTGWKIISMTGGTEGTYTEADSWGGFNFADRNSTNKDLYGAGGSNRVFSQGAYFDVPKGVTAITIEPYWGQAAYVCDQYYDVVYNNEYGAQNVTLFGKQHDNNTDIDLYGDGNKQKVYTTMDNARKSMSIPTSGKTVYDYAVVLVGNVHQYAALSGDATPYTIMSVDMNHDNEPDYSFIFSHNSRQPISPIRFDFINIPGISEAQMPKGATTFRNPTIFKPKGWFEITNTCVVNFAQFEYDNGSKALSPLILLGGTFEQFVSTQSSDPDHNTSYIHLGSNVWFSKFGNGTHSDGNKFTPHIPVSVTGGDYDEFYLSGTYQPNISNMKADNAECYVSGGRFGEMAAASLENIDGDVHWDINWADITNFYGGGVNANNPITGSILVDIANSHVNLYCGGPKFGDMSDDKTVTTNAVDCNFGTYFGAGYGGNSFNRVKYRDEQNMNFTSRQSEFATDRGKYFNGTTTNAPGGAAYGKKGKGVAVDFDYEFFTWSTGVTGGRFYVKFVSFSLAKTHNVTSNLQKCTINGNFYGGASYGKVDGDVTSVLNNCTVSGSVYGAGFSASLPTINVRKTPAFVKDYEPKINKEIGMFEMGQPNTTEEFQWKQVTAMPANGNNGMESISAGNFVYTDEDLSGLGTVAGNVTLNITGNETVISGDIYGGGALANSNTDYYKATNPVLTTTTTVNLLSGRVVGNVYGGGQGRAGVRNAENPEVYDVEPVAALVGSTAVNLNGQATDNIVADDVKGFIVGGSIFGCNNINGTPMGNATVTVYGTQNAAQPDIQSKVSVEEGEAPVYDVEAVYGGGNLAAYNPSDPTTKEARVVIYGCDRSYIRYVYGGGNAAPAPATYAVVHGGSIDYLFGGGNGRGADNPGANVGYYTYTDEEEKVAYGTGVATTEVRGGTINNVFGGSNSKGNIRTEAHVILDYDDECDFNIGEVYGGGNEAPMDGTINLDMRCIPGLAAVYGGAKSADIDNDVELTITSGTYGRVFGGNNVSGTINGSITVNVQETGCNPINIGQLYGCGNAAPYVTPEGKAQPTVNIISHTTIGEVFGGGLGETAVVTGSPTVNINVVPGRHADKIDADGDGEADGDATLLGTIGTVYGGGNAAQVDGNTIVNIRNGNISGNVFGGGLGATAVVTGNTNVNVGE